MLKKIYIKYFYIDLFDNLDYIKSLINRSSSIMTLMLDINEYYLNLNYFQLNTNHKYYLKYNHFI